MKHSFIYFQGSTERICLIDTETVQSLHSPVYRATGDIVKVSIQVMCPMLASENGVFNNVLPVAQLGSC
jgi:hypothetical protein